MVLARTITWAENGLPQPAAAFVSCVREAVRPRTASNRSFLRTKSMSVT